MKDIHWMAPWRAIQFDAEVPGVQRQLDMEITATHPLFGQGAVAVGRRIDNDDVVAILSDGTYVNVHLVWGRSGGGPFADEFPSWLAYDSLEAFEAAMANDAGNFGDD
jgi:hypothetical protein